MSTDTAFALGMLALVGRGFPDRLRVFLLTVAVVDDLVALLVIAHRLHGRTSASCRCSSAVARVRPVAAASAAQGPQRAALLRARRSALGGAAASPGVDPVVVGLVDGPGDDRLPGRARRTSSGRPACSGCSASSRPPSWPQSAPSRAALGDLAQRAAAAAVPPDGPAMSSCRCSRWPTPASRSTAVCSPARTPRRSRSGILLGYVVGKPIGVAGSTWLVTKLSRGRLRPPVGWASVLGGGAIAGIGFTVSLLIATLAFHGDAARGGQARRPDRGRSSRRAC